MQVQVVLNGSGMRELLGSPEVEAMLQRKADAVANAARSRAPMVEGTPGDQPMPIDVVNASSDRARYLVVADHAAGVAVEVKHRLLVSSLDAARA